MSVVQTLCTRLSETRSLVTETIIFFLAVINLLKSSKCKYRTFSGAEYFTTSYYQSLNSSSISMYCSIPARISLLYMNSSAECERAEAPGPILIDGNGMIA